MVTLIVVLLTAKVAMLIFAFKRSSDRVVRQRERQYRAARFMRDYRNAILESDRITARAKERMRERAGFGSRGW